MKSELEANNPNAPTGVLVQPVVRSAPMRWPVMVKFYDADMKEHIFGPITVEVDELAQADNPGDWWMHLDNEARKYLQADMSCDALEGLMGSKGASTPNSV